MTNWKPIKTAPKDGRPIKVKGESIVHWREGDPMILQHTGWTQDEPFRLTHWKALPAAGEP